MSLFDKIKTFVTAEDDDDFDDEDFDEPETRYSPPKRPSHGLSSSTETMPRREPIREPLYSENARDRDKVIPMRGGRGSEAVRRITEKLQIVLIEPKGFDDCPKLVDSLKNRKPVIINLENIENDTARKIFDFLSGATYALNGNVQKIAQNIFVFLPENVDVQGTTNSQSYKYGEEKENPWT